ncbi:hypothetical protein [Gordonia malaquae]|uniref:Uncharacterized protein n=1 Tax=Gordonia phage GRU3 TaxID=1647473 RepID=A0A0K0N613_9CAUD|nr:hypothetical protein BH785_gp21 [Gordonia phage GRU3]AKJ72270.1 hypothetical protein GRU3_21 [Gordonia phage GRU3]
MTDDDFGQAKKALISMSFGRDRAGIALVANEALTHLDLMDECLYRGRPAWITDPTAEDVSFTALGAKVDRVADDVDNVKIILDSTASVLCEGLDGLSKTLDGIAKGSNGPVLRRPRGAQLAYCLAGVAGGIGIAHVGFLSVVVWKLNRKAGA